MPIKKLLKSNNYKKILLLICSLVASMNLAMASSQQPTNEKPAQFSSDDAKCQQQKNGDNICTYSGKATLDQQNSHLDAQQITVFKNNKGDIYQIVAQGGRAHYRTSVQSDEKTTAEQSNKKPVSAEANIIKLLPPKNLAVFTGDAILTQNQDTFTGSHLEYDIKKQTILSTPSNNDLTTVVLHPENANKNHNQ
jgi:lipopolysaccharide transport protein LptA